MGLFDKFRKKEAPQPEIKPEPKPVEINAPPYQQYCIIDGQWHLNPNYDPSAPKPEQVKVYGLDDDDEEDDDD